MVVRTAPGFPGLRVVYRLRELRDYQLQLRRPAVLRSSRHGLSFADVLAAADQGSACVVAVLRAVFRHDADPVGASRIPLYLLLLSRRLLQSLVGGSNLLCRRRGSQDLLGRAQVAAP